MARVEILEFQQAFAATPCLPAVAETSWSTQAALRAIAGGIIASQVNPGMSGAGGNVTVDAGSIKITGTGAISTSTFGAGNSGRLTVSVADALTIDGVNAPDLSTGIFSQANPASTGNAGIVGVNTGRILIINGGTISAGTFGPGNGGSVAVGTAGELAIDGSLTPGFYRDFLTSQ